MEEQQISIEQIAADLAPGYDQLRPLGSGGMGDLFLAHKTGLDVPVAVKILKDNVKTQLDERQEAEILKSLKHQYLPKIYDVIVTPQGVLYTVMDFISGDNLKDYVKKHGPVDQKTAYKWATQLCEVTAYLHAQNPAIIHSDIKPGNVMITPGGDICLIDFNTSLQLRDGLMAVGKTDGYAAPEQYTKSDIVLAGMQMAAGLSAGGPGNETVSGTGLPGDDSTILPESSSRSSRSRTAAPRSRSTGSERFSFNRRRSTLSSSRTRSGSVTDYGPVSKRTDVYAIGATLYYALTGKNPPHALKDGKPLSAWHLRISRSFLQIIERAMEKTAGKRFSGAAEMGRALAEIHRIDKQYRKVHTLTILAVCMEVALLAGGVGLLYAGQNQLVQEQNDSYIHMLNEVQQQRDDGNYDQALALTDEAQGVMDTRMEAHAERATVYYKQALAATDADEREKFFTLCVDTVQELLDGSFEGGTAAEWSKACFVGAESATELENYGLAEKWYARSIEYLPAENNYTGYIYALVMDGKMNEAEQALQQMRAAVPEAESQYAADFLGAELACLNGDYKSAIEQYQDMLEDCQDEALLRRGYLAVSNACVHALTDSYDTETQTFSADYTAYADDRIKFMEEAVARLPGSRSLFLPLLADAYNSKANLGGEDASEYLSKARDAYESIGTDKLSFSDRLNLNWVYIGQGEWDCAIEDLQKMDTLYAGNYKVKLLLAMAYWYRCAQYADSWNQTYNEADKELGLADIASCSEYLVQALEYYSASGASDPEMDGYLSALTENIAAQANTFS